LGESKIAEGYDVARNRSQDGSLRQAASGILYNQGRFGYSAREALAGDGNSRRNGCGDRNGSSASVVVATKEVVGDLLGFSFVYG
jgi:hypothetical protein